MEISSTKISKMVISLDKNCQDRHQQNLPRPKIDFSLTKIHEIDYSSTNIGKMLFFLIKIADQSGKSWWACVYLSYFIQEKYHIINMCWRKVHLGNFCRGKSTSANFIGWMSALATFVNEMSPYYQFWLKKSPSWQLFSSKSLPKQILSMKCPSLQFLSWKLPFRQFFLRNVCLGIAWQICQYRQFLDKNCRDRLFLNKNSQDRHLVDKIWGDRHSINKNFWAGNVLLIDINC